MFCFIFTGRKFYGILKIRKEPFFRKPEERLDETMKITVVGRQMNVYDEMKDLIEHKLSKFDKYFSGEASATVTLSCKHNEKNLEITISAANTLFRSEIGAASFRTALDEATEAIERQIRRNKTRVARRLRTGGIEVMPEDFFAPDEPDTEDDETILRTKTFPVKPMTPEEAILQMNLLGHQFFVFNNGETGQTCVVYARRDGAYGLIVPEV